MITLTPSQKRLLWSIGRLAFLLAAPFTVAAHLKWMAEVAKTNPLASYVISAALIYVVARVSVDLLTDANDLVSNWRTLGRAQMPVAMPLGPTGEKFRMSWQSYFVMVWFNVFDTLMAVIGLCATIYGMTRLLHPPNPQQFYEAQFGRPIGLWSPVFGLLTSIGPLAIFEAAATSVLPLPYRWLGAKVLPESRIIFPWQR